MNYSEQIIAASHFSSLELLGNYYSIWLNNRSPLVRVEYRDILQSLEKFGGMKGAGLNRVFFNRNDAEKAWTYLMVRWS